MIILKGVQHLVAEWEKECESVAKGAGLTEGSSQNQLAGLEHPYADKLGHFPTDSEEALQIAIAEYQALRREIETRLETEHTLLRYVILVGAALPLFGIADLRSIAGTEGFLAALLFGPLACMFLQTAWLKNHLFIAMIADYIARRLPPFSGWETFLTENIHPPKQSVLDYIHSALPDWLQALFPSLFASPYLIIFVIVFSQDKPNMPFIAQWFFFLAWWIEAFMLAGVVITTFYSYHQNAERRRRALAKPVANESAGAGESTESGQSPSTPSSARNSSAAG